MPPHAISLDFLDDILKGSQTAATGEHSMALELSCAREAEISYYRPAPSCCHVFVTNAVVMGINVLGHALHHQGHCNTADMD